MRKGYYPKRELRIKRNTYSGAAPTESPSGKGEILQLKLGCERAKDWEPVSKLGVP